MAACSGEQRGKVQALGNASWKLATFSGKSGSGKSAGKSGLEL
jgi:hypothetical protein